MENPRLQASLRDLTAVLFRRKRSALTVALVSLLTGLAWLFLVRGEAWEATGKILVTMGREQAPPPTMLDERGIVLGDPIQHVNSEVDLLKNRDLIARVVDTLGMDAPPEPPPMPGRWLPRIPWAFQRFSKAVGEALNGLLIRVGVRERVPHRDAVIARLYDGTVVTPQENSGVVVVRMFLPERRGAADVLNTLLDLYQDFRLEALDDQGAVDFFLRRTEETDARLRDLDEALATLEMGGGVKAYDAQVQMLLVRVNEARKQEEEARLEWVESTNRRRRFEEEEGKGESTYAGIGVWPEGSLPADLLHQITEVNRERERLRLTELDGSPLMENLEAQEHLLIESLRAAVAAEAAEASGELDERRQVVADLEGRLRALGLEQATLAALERERTASERSYQSFQAKLEEAEVNRALALAQLDNVAIIERAIDPVQPAGPRKMLLMQVLIVLSVFGALAWVAVAEFFDQRVHSREDLERGLGVPVLASIPLREGTERMETADATRG